MDTIFDDLLNNDHKFDPWKLCITLYAAASINYYKWSVFDSAILSLQDVENELSVNDLGYLVSALAMVRVDTYNQFL